GWQRPLYIAPTFAQRTAAYSRDAHNRGSSPSGGAMLDHSCQVQRHSYEERGDDVYMTPAVATQALLRHIEPKLPQHLHESACGDCTGILDPLRAAGHTVIGSDLNNYGRPDCFWHRDFLAELKAPDHCECGITNPPYKLVEEFVRHALKLYPRLVLLLR